MSPATLSLHGLFQADRFLQHSHALLLLPMGKTLPENMPARSQWLAMLKRRDSKLSDLAKTPLALDLPNGGRLACAMIDPAKSRFERLTLLRKAVMLLLDETPDELSIGVYDNDLDVVRDAAYVALLNGALLPVRKKKPGKQLSKVHVFGATRENDFSAVSTLARGNLLARELTALPPNELTPASYRRRIRELAKSSGWSIEEYDYKRLKKIGAGAFCAVAQGSDHEDAAIVHLRWQPKGAGKSIALVGKGICFDTGGHNLKPARYMAGMHEDMNGSAVVLGLLQTIAALKLTVAVDAWLAIAHNHLSPKAYTQNSVVKALNGTTIEIVHTDAEGRMVLADTLTLAAKNKPQLMIDFATLTGSMHAALGSRYSGIFATTDVLGRMAVDAGRQSGERVCLFPFDEDYEPALDSKVADIKQCTLEGEADHILAARFLNKFTDDRPWLHVDLSASSCTGGLGAAATDLTGFGVAWGIHFLQRWLHGE
ncbi:Aminopeptidase PepA-related protein [Georgfuchsia toluolica]|uniref:Aminopeptidase PepA-related protein n=1 Tax=Georgfuchsia toluolica TaxID=424218 RepID=A0A916J5A5_9PROT|nr:leucyl aminopeptidase family protein [Georgfuchsia toluolica]CAG4884946.1 Aminopeptidase PepA-related protein [Georgfuchsia toluolica]